MGNGDVYTASDALRMKKETGCDGIMVARGALGNPWLFSEIKAAFEGKDYAAPTASERLSLAKRLLSIMVEQKGERIGCAEAKKQISWFIRDISGAASCRAAVMNADGSKKILEILDYLIESNQ